MTAARKPAGSATFARKPVEAPSAVTVDDFDAWVARAEPKDALIYARGAEVPRAAPAWKHAMSLVEEGMITLACQRAGGGITEYLAIRLTTATAAPVSSVPIPHVDETNPSDLVLREISRAATFKLPCPSNALIAQRCGLSDAAAASYRIRQLVAAKRITIESQGPGEPRVATIVGSGKSTAKVV